MKKFFKATCKFIGKTIGYILAIAYFPIFILLKILIIVLRCLLGLCHIGIAEFRHGWNLIKYSFVR